MSTDRPGARQWVPDRPSLASLTEASAVLMSRDRERDHELFVRDLRVAAQAL
jgi:hypothetical protein